MNQRHQQTRYVSGLFAGALGLMALVFVTGCADSDLYEAPTSAPQAAEVKAPTEAQIDSHRIQSIDGKSICGCLAFLNSSVEIAPGHHDLTVEAVWDSRALESHYRELFAISFRAAAHHSYAVRQLQTPSGPPRDSSAQIAFGSPFGMLTLDSPLQSAGAPLPEYHMYVWVQDLTDNRPVGGTPPP